MHAKVCLLSVLLGCRVLGTLKVSEANVHLTRLHHGAVSCQQTLVPPPPSPSSVQVSGSGPDAGIRCAVCPGGTSLWRGHFFFFFDAKEIQISNLGFPPGCL